MAGSIKLHPKHGLAPVMTGCEVCHEDTGIALLGAAYEKVFPGQEPSSAQRLLTGLCDSCQKLLEEGAAAFVTENRHRTFMLTPEAVKKFAEQGVKDVPAPGVVHIVSDEWMDVHQPPQKGSGDEAEDAPG